MSKGYLFERIRVLCPACREELLDGESGGCIVCRSCNAAYPQSGRLIDLIPGGHEADSIPQQVMEFPPVVSIYESRLWRRNPLFSFFMGLTFEEECELMLDAVRLESSDAVLDLACGTGIYGLRIASRMPGATVVGLDLSLPMLTHARQCFEAQGISNYLLIHGDAGEIPLQDGEIDAVLCGGALHLFPSLETAVREVRRVLKPGGRFAASVFSPGKGQPYGCISSAVQMIKGIRGIRPKEIENILSEAGFKDIVCHHAAGVWIVFSAAAQGG